MSRLCHKWVTLRQFPTPRGLWVKDLKGTYRFYFEEKIVQPDQTCIWNRWSSAHTQPIRIWIFNESFFMTHESWVKLWRISWQFTWLKPNWATIFRNCFLVKADTTPAAFLFILIAPEIFISSYLGQILKIIGTARTSRGGLTRTSFLRRAIPVVNFEISFFVYFLNFEKNFQHHSKSFASDPKNHHVSFDMIFHSLRFGILGLPVDPCGLRVRRP